MSGKKIIHIGNSMFPAIKERDVLNIIPIKKIGKKIEVGDIISFFSTSAKRILTHRIHIIKPNYFITKGDLNLTADMEKVKKTNIYGFVGSLIRGGKTIKVIGGQKGRIWAELFNIFNRLKYFSFFLLKYLIYRFKWLNYLKDSISINSKIKVFCFKKNKEKEYRLFFGKKIIGHLSRLNSPWILKKPYGFLVKTDSLPKINEKTSC